MPCWTQQHMKEEDRKNLQNEIDKFFNETAPAFFEKLDPYLNNGKSFLFDDKLTLADFYIGGIYTNFCINDKAFS